MATSFGSQVLCCLVYYVEEGGPAVLDVTWAWEIMELALQPVDQQPLSIKSFPFSHFGALECLV